jgi:putative endonuclease
MSLPAQRARGRLAAYRLGHWAEHLAAAFLIAKGFTIIARRYAAQGGEIDLVARRRDLLLFVEVKARADRDVAAQAITRRKRQRFGRAARHYLAHHPWSATMTVRCDAVFLAPWRFPLHVPHAFPLPD